MKNQQTKMNEFDRVLENTPDDELVQQVLSEIENNPELGKEFQEHKVLVDGIRYAARHELMEKMKEWDKSMDSSPKARLMRIRPIWYFAAASIALILATVAILTVNLNSSNEHLLAKHYEPYHYEAVIMRGEEAKGNEFTDAYEKADYKMVIELYNAGNTAEDTEMTGFLYANACLALGMTDKALPEFERLSRLKSPLTPAATWYLAICYISQNDKQIAKSRLLEVAAMKSSYSAKASALLQEMN